MLTNYPDLTEEEIARKGETWWTCDTKGCDAEIQIDSDQVPNGWRTSDPDQDPLAGAAQMCPKHAKKIVFASDLEE